MNIREPHDIIDEPALKNLRDTYVRISEKEAARLADASPETRAAWLRENLVIIDRKAMRKLTNLPLRERGESLRTMLVELGWTPPAGPGAERGD